MGFTLQLLITKKLSYYMGGWLFIRTNRFACASHNEVLRFLPHYNKSRGMDKAFISTYILLIKNKAIGLENILQ